MGTRDPSRDFPGTFSRLTGQIALDQQSNVVAAARINPGTIDMGHANRGEIHTHRPRQERLHRDIIPVAIFHAGGRFDFDHFPRPAFPFDNGNHHVGECDCLLTFETCLENRTCPLREQPCALFECCREAILGHIDANARFIWIVNPPRDIPDLVSDFGSLPGWPANPAGVLADGLRATAASGTGEKR